MWIACLQSKDVSKEMKKHADNLTPSHFGEANDSMINRKQRHRKQCEMRDGSGVYQSHWARWKHTGSHAQLAHMLPCWWSGFIHEIQVNSSIPTIICPAFLQSQLCDCVFPKWSEKRSVLYRLLLSQPRTTARSCKFHSYQPVVSMSR